MKKIIKHTLIGAALLNFMLVASVGANESMKEKGQREHREVKQEGAGEYMDDSYITAKIKSALLAEPDLKSMDIKVVTSKGIATLSGQVDSKENMQRAIDVTREVKGVKSVKNYLRLN